MTQALGLEWARYGIRVNALAPGYIGTDINREFFETPPGQAMLKRIRCAGSAGGGPRRAFLLAAMLGDEGRRCGGRGIGVGV